MTPKPNLRGEARCRFTNFAVTGADMSLRNWLVGAMLRKEGFVAPTAAAKK
jgi:hypothetical protein